MRENDAVPRVSVIIPAHNAAPFLDETLASVRAQTHDEWENLACDDGSRDGTWEVLNTAGPGVHAIRNEQAGGPAVARNRALSSPPGSSRCPRRRHLILPRYLESQLAAYERASALPGAPVGLVACDAKFLIDGEYASYTTSTCCRTAMPRSRSTGCSGGTWSTARAWSP